MGCFAFWLFERSFVFVFLPLYWWSFVAVCLYVLVCVCAIGFYANVLCVLLMLLYYADRCWCSVMSMVFLQPFSRSWKVYPHHKWRSISHHSSYTINNIYNPIRSNTAQRTCSVNLNFLLLYPLPVPNSKIKQACRVCSRIDARVDHNKRKGIWIIYVYWNCILTCKCCVSSANVRAFAFAMQTIQWAMFSTVLLRTSSLVDAILNLYHSYSANRLPNTYRMSVSTDFLNICRILLVLSSFHSLDLNAVSVRLLFLVGSAPHTHTKYVSSVNILAHAQKTTTTMNEIHVLVKLSYKNIRCDNKYSTYNAYNQSNKRNVTKW